jgi:hypothetical protein
MLSTSEKLTLLVFFFGIGLPTLAAGVSMRVGIWKGWFIVKRVPVLLPTSYLFGFVPAGLSFISVGAAIAVDNSARYIFWCVTFPLFVISILLAIWQPGWIKPAWYRWLDEHYGDIIPILQEEARQLGAPKWGRRVATQKGLEQWVDEVRRKRGLVKP